MPESLPGNHGIFQVTIVCTCFPLECHIYTSIFEYLILQITTSKEFWLASIIENHTYFKKFNSFDYIFLVYFKEKY
jgi:hypothetical protein